MNCEVTHSSQPLKTQFGSVTLPIASKVILVGNPNVGKSALFNQLTKRYVSVSNYPGTTVSISRGEMKTKDLSYEVLDTPGMYSLSPLTDDERAAKKVLIDHPNSIIVHVIDAKNLDRMLALTLQLKVIFPQNLILVLNMMDEAKRVGFKIDTQKLEMQLGCPVIETVSIRGQGISKLKEKIDALSRDKKQIQDNDAKVIQFSQAHALLRQEKINEIVSQTTTSQKMSPQRVSKFLDRVIMHPVLGYVVLALVLYYGIYQFVGVFAAGTLVDFIETTLFEENINPWMTSFFQWIIPWKAFSELFVGEYGVFTLGVRYAVALVLPIVGAFFLVFSLLEDTGYLPRLSLLLDRVFKKIGLNGRAVIPMILGLGCDTMATMVTRVLETKREKIIATLLLALAIPCSAQLGLILALLATNPNAMMLWASVVVLEFLLVGFLASKILPGTKPQFYMEVPPLRFPLLSNVVSKTWARMKWYFLEVFPLFILASVLIWVGIQTGVFQWIIHSLEPLMAWLGLPAQMAVVTLFGFFRRDYGAAGLFDLQSQNILTGNQLAVSAIILTLFLPCIAQFLIMKKERGLKVTLIMCGFVFVMAFGTGFFVSKILTVSGISL